MLFELVDLFYLVIIDLYSDLHSSDCLYDTAADSRTVCMIQLQIRGLDFQGECRGLGDQSRSKRD